MDEVTKTLLDDFINFLSKEFQQMKDFKTIQFVRWTLKDFRVSIEIVHNDQHKKIYFDIREIKENKDRFVHLIGNAKDQLEQIVH